MPEIKHNFTKGKMNKDLDERLVPNGEYRDALNVQVSTSEGSDVGTLQNILGNSLVTGQSFLDDMYSVGSIADEKNDKLYYFVTSKELITSPNLNSLNGWTTSNAGSPSVGSGSHQFNDDGNYSHLQAEDFILVDGQRYDVEIVIDSIDDGVGLGVNDSIKYPRLMPQSQMGIAGTYKSSFIADTRVTARFKIYHHPHSNADASATPAVANTLTNGAIISYVSVKKSTSAIIEYDSKTNSITPVLVDTIGDVLKFGKIDNTITGINIIDDLLLWTDNVNEPKKINIPRCKAGTSTNPTTGLVHTNLIVKGNSEGLIKEEHITVIKRNPSKAPGVRVVDQNNINYSSGAMKRYPYFYPPGPNVSGSTYAIVEEGHEMWISIPNSPSGENPQMIIGDVIKVYLGENPPSTDENNNPEQPIAMLLVKEVVDKSGQSFRSTQIQNDFGNLSPIIADIGEKAFKVVVSSLAEHTTFPTSTPLQPRYYFKVQQEGKGIFDKKLPRFAYRYKYEDGEYSSVGPFSEVIFVPGKFNYHPTEAYNKGMINHLKKLTLQDFVTADIPKDVVQIDLLYKNEFSPNVFVVKTVDKNDGTWLSTGSSLENSTETGSYAVTTENIYAQLPSDQLIRPWDNVPKKALAQEITGNRVVYGNYLQNYNLEDKDGNKIYPNLQANLDNRRYNNEKGGARKSIKSQRTYNFGIVYGDNYGRETPVFTNETSNQLITKASSSNANAISINVTNKPPVWADYYKIFVKETSNEYYNLAMGRMYDAEDGNVWLSFPSIDRNKVDEDTYLVLKKGSEANTNPVTSDAKYKIVAIENEAPDYVKTVYEVECETTHNSTWTSFTFGGGNAFFTPPAKLPTPGSRSFTIDKKHWTTDGSDAVVPTKNLGLPDLVDVFNKSEDNLYVSFSSVDYNEELGWNNSPKRMSKKYQVSEITAPSTMLASSGDNNDMYNIIITEIIPAADEWYTKYVTTRGGSQSIDLRGGLTVHFYRKIVENKPEFDGRFFVKIYEDSVIRQYLTASTPKNNQSWKVDAQIQLYYIADASAPHIVTVGGGGTTTPPVNPQPLTPQPHTSMTQSDWIRNLGGANNSRWFVDAASFAGLQPLDELDPRKSIFHSASQDLSDVLNPVHYYEYDPNITTSDGGAMIHFGEASSGGNSGNSNLGTSQIYAQNIIKFPRGTAANPSFDGAFKNGITDGPDPLATSSTHPVNRPAFLKIRGDEDILSYQAVSTSGHSLSTATYLHKSFLKSTVRSIGTKQSLGASNAFLKGAHQATYDVSLLGDLNTNGGYVDQTGVAGSDNYLHLSYGGVGDARPSSTEFSNALDRTLSHRAEFWDNYRWLKNWWVGKDGNTSDFFNGENSTNNIEHDVVTKLKPNSLFRLEGNANIYKINRVTKRRLYNHTGAMEDVVDSLNEFEEFMVDPNSRSNRIRTYSQQGSTLSAGTQFNTTNLIAPSDIRSEVIADNTTASIDASYCDTSVIAQHKRMVAADNCRLSYLIKYEVLTGAVNKVEGGLDEKPFHDNPQFDTRYMNIDSFANLQFVSEFSSTKKVLLPADPAIFETEPKEDVGLDIYYEATGKIPTDASSPNTKIQNLIDIGATLVTTPSSSAYPHGAFVTDIVYDTTKGNWVVTTSAKIKETELRDRDLRFYNDNGTYTVANWIDPNPPLANTNPAGTTSTGTGPSISSGIGIYQGPPLQIQAYGGPDEGINVIDVIIRPNIIGLSWFNCWSFGNGVESNRIGDTYNKPFITNGVKVSTTLLDSYEEEHRKYGLIYSGIYNSTSGVNDLNQFIAAEKITKDVNPVYGSIQKLHSRSSADGDLIALCEDRVLKILANKDALYNADGNPQLIANNNVLGQTIPFSGEFGISTNPESFASESYRVYFTDKIRGAVMRLSKDGLTPISNFGMKDWFRDNLKLSSKLIGSYDDKKQEYNITLADRKTLGEEIFQNHEMVNSDFWETSSVLSADYSQSGVLITSSGGTSGVPNYPFWRQRGINLVDGKTYELKVGISDIDNGGTGVSKIFIMGDNASGGNSSYRPYYNDDYYNVSIGSSGEYNNVFTFNQAANNNDTSMQFYVEMVNGATFVKQLRVKYISLKPVINDPTTVSFKENVKGWVGFKSFIPEHALSMASDYYSLVSGKLYKHHNEHADRNNFYGVGYNSSVNVLFNDSPSVIKTFHTLNYEGSESKSDTKAGWFSTSIQTDKQEGNILEFIEKEGKWFNYIKGIDSDEIKDLNTADFNVQGIGALESIVISSGANVMSFNKDINFSLQKGDTIYYKQTASDEIVRYGEVVEIQNKAATVDESVFGSPTDPSVDAFIFFAKNHTVNTSSLLGYYADVKFENNSTDKIELFSIGSEVSESSK